MARLTKGLLFYFIQDRITVILFPFIMENNYSVQACCVVNGLKLVEMKTDVELPAYNRGTNIWMKLVIVQLDSVNTQTFSNDVAVVDKSNSLKNEKKNENITRGHIILICI